ncbi:hypothetical protein [Asticcacaulis benevestitus]|uniref:Glycosyltransferase RgtA/B/C/D-like domain-containing protein n=1 Tax=Asticcacaulis benevestitus DSM 16100 = ATCC BAA-896 TaxID=1121022 RepID=V4PIR9_9CAUL|nr:hypothetical protein [Asticcacaulis benevestitus]ESQ93857.1 hypothetical protein ABENE_04005 [Asticcacaulis benevestitus DSM 16100 = ATCC BAA-896]
MSINSKTLYLAAVAAILALSMGLAIAFGYISVDSWYYIFLADSLRHGQGCSLNGTYLAVYPCGYPTMLALTAPVADPAFLMVSSKLTNFLLLAASFVFVYKASRNLLMATLIVINPVTLLIGMYTWSENLLLFCVCGTFFAISLIHTHPRKWAFYGLLALFLVLGCFARYIFAPFAFILFICTWLAYGRATALRTLACFAIAGVVFLGYQAFNHHMTGYGTGMPRIAAPEAKLLLIRQFIIAVAGCAFGIIAVIVVLAGASWNRLSLSREKTSPAVTFVLLAGLGFLALAFVLRFRTQFDPYNVRTIGYGVVLTLAGLAGRYIRWRKDEPPKIWALLACGLACVIFCDGLSIPQDLSDLRTGYQFPAASVSDLIYKGPPLATVVYFQLPASALDTGNVDNIPQLHYGKSVRLITPMSDTDKPETAASFLHDLDDVPPQGCVFDFTAFASVRDFDTFLSSRTLMDHRFSLFGGAPQTLSKPDYDPGLKAWLIDIIQAGRMVPCRDILSLPSSRRIATLS